VKDIMVLIGLGLGIILILLGMKLKNVKALKVVGILMIIISLIIAAPDIISGFVDGFKNGYK
jgi:hypothetical protein